MNMKIKLVINRGKGKEKKQKAEKWNKNNPGAGGKKEMEEDRSKSLLGALEHGWQCACWSQTPSFLRSGEGFGNQDALKGIEVEGVEDAAWVTSARGPHRAEGRMLQMCPCGPGSGCSRGSLHLSQGARVWRLRCVKDVQLNWDGCCPGDGPQSPFSLWVESLRLVQFKKVEITLESFKMFVNEMSKNK